MLRLGWIPDFPDFRDLTAASPSIGEAFAELKTKISSDKLPASADLKEWCSPVKDQFKLQSCTANAAVSLMEYYERRASGNYIEGSRLFVYKVTRNIMQLNGDTGANIRSAMAAMVLFGISPEKYWTYSIERFDDEPPAFCYAFASNYKTVQYYRFDPPNTNPVTLMQNIKISLARGFPVLFGYTVYSSMDQAKHNGYIPFPSVNDSKRGGHAVMAVGYDDNLKIVNSLDEKESTGAILFQNSWGTEWGQNGYGWLPYEYVLRGLAADWWTLIKASWIDTGNFG